MAAKLRKIFGPSVEKVLINSNQRKLQDLVDERNKVALVLEGAESKLIKQVNKIAIKKGIKDVPANYDRNISTLYVEKHKRPRHRVGKLVIKFLLGEKVQKPIEHPTHGRLTQLNGRGLNSPVSIQKLP